MNKPFLLTSLTTTIVNLVLHVVAYALVLKDVFGSHPAISPEFHTQLVRSADELIMWAMVATSLTMGTLIVLVMTWSGARTFGQGLKQGALFGFLFWSAVNLGLYASSNHFSTVAMFVDLVSSSVIMTIAAAFAAWMLGRLRVPAAASSE